MIAFIRQDSIINVFGYFTGTLKFLYVRNRIRIMLPLGVRRDAHFQGALYRSETLLMNRVVGFFFSKRKREVQLKKS